MLYDTPGPPGKDEIQKAGDVEIQQVIDLKIGVIAPKWEVVVVLKDTGKVLNVKIPFKRNTR